MRVAIPLHGDEVSPRIGSRALFLVASIEEGRIVEEHLVDTQNRVWLDLAVFLASQGITTMICGGIQRELQSEIEGRGIEVIWGIIGPASAALMALISGTLHSDQFVGRDAKADRITFPSSDRAGGPPAKGPAARLPDGVGEARDRRSEDRYDKPGTQCSSNY